LVTWDCGQHPLREMLKNTFLIYNSSKKLRKRNSNATQTAEVLPGFDLIELFWQKVIHFFKLDHFIK
jgi:hypothetical protein